MNYLNNLIELLNHWVVGVDFQNIFVSPVVEVLSQSSCLIDSFSIGGRVGNVSYDGNWVVDESQRNLNILNVFVELLLSVVDQRLELLLQVFGLFAGIICLVRFFEIVFSNIHNFVAIVLSKNIENCFIERVITKNDFIALLNKSLNEW